MEQAIDEGYLQRLCNAYVQHFHGYDGAPVMTVVTDDFNPLDRAADFEHLLSLLDGFSGRRAVLDPGAQRNGARMG